MIEFYPLVAARDWPLVDQHIGVRWCEDTRGIIAVDKDGSPAGLCVLDSWTPTAVQAHIWIGNPLCIRRGFLNEIATYVFVTSGRRVIVGIVPSNNSKALKFDRKIGFKEIGRVVDGHDMGVDTVIMEMRRDNCRWLNDGQESRSAA